MIADDLFMLCAFTVLTTPLVLVAWILEKVLERQEKRQRPQMATMIEDDE